MLCHDLSACYHCSLRARTVGIYFVADSCPVIPFVCLRACVIVYVIVTGLRFRPKKCDLSVDKHVPKEEIQQLCDDHGFIGWVETSAKDDINIDNAMKYLIKHILAIYDAHNAPPAKSELLDLHGRHKKQKKPGDCC